MCIKKEITINTVRSIFSNSRLLALYQDSGLSTQDHQKMQTLIQQNQLKSLHLKNKLSRVALKDSKHQSFSTLLEGPCVVVYSSTSKINPKYVYSLHKDFPKLLPIGGILGDCYLSSKQFDWVSSLNDLSQFHRSIFQTITSNTIDLSHSINQISMGLVNTVNCIKQK